MSASGPWGPRSNAWRCELNPVLGEATLLTCGVHMVHEPAFSVDRPRGSGEWVFVSFRVPVEILTTHGREVAQPGDCIWFAPDSPTWYRGHGVGLDNDWAHLGYPGLGRLLAHYDVPVLQLLRPRDRTLAEDVLTRLHRELLSERPFGADALQLLVEELVLRLARALQAAEPAGLSAVEAEHFERFVSLRARVYQRLDDPWDVGGMAREVNLSVPRFSVLYRRFFGVSPSQDLLGARIERAKRLLADGTSPVATIASRSGFESACHFSRLFRQRVGSSPRAWRDRVRGRGDAPAAG